MKRLWSAFCIVLIVFNSIEYYGLLLLAQMQWNEQVLQRIETNSNELGGNLILSIPIAFPYSSDSEEYMRVDGEFAYEGDLYRMVKQKFYHDKLYIVCVKANQDTQKDTALADYSRLFSGKEAESANASINIVNSLSQDYISKLQLSKSQCDVWCRIFCPRPLIDLYSLAGNGSVFHPPNHC